ncbi:MAG TPA: acyl-ACP--UDP-N-acetylglucosamine O-acyltransferase [Elusimicrobiota bacterium]|nr:acyl-ACP--UDP-N-acetylglucosamine O-acyltransferase [Elusimicrobiota bacterium]
MTETHSPHPAHIHPTAIVDPSAKIGEGVVIGPYAVIGPDVQIAPHVSIGAHAIVEHARLGTHCKIHPHAFVGTPPQDLKYKGEKTHVRIGAHTVIRECVTVNRGTTASGETVVGENCLLMAYSHVAHDCVVGNNVIMANVATLAGHVHVEDSAVLGGLVAIHQYVRIGQGAMLGGGSMVAQDVAPFCMTQGDRAVIVGLNVVGLRRRGLSPESLSALKNAYKIAFLSGLNLPEAVAQIEKHHMPKEVRLFADFLKKPSHGLCRPPVKIIEKDLEAEGA